MTRGSTMSGGVDGLPCGDTLRFAADAGSYTHRTCKKKKTAILRYVVAWTKKVQYDY